MIYNTSAKYICMMFVRVSVFEKKSKTVKYEIGALKCDFNLYIQGLVRMFCKGYMGISDILRLTILYFFWN